MILYYTQYATLNGINGNGRHVHILKSLKNNLRSAYEVRDLSIQILMAPLF